MTDGALDRIIDPPRGAQFLQLNLALRTAVDIERHHTPF